VKVLPCITAERSALLASCLSEARTQFVGKMVSKKNAVRCSDGFQGPRALQSRVDSVLVVIIWSDARQYT